MCARWILLVVESLKVFRKNGSMAVLESSSFLAYEVLANGCLLLKNRAPYQA